MKRLACWFLCTLLLAGCAGDKSETTAESQPPPEGQVQPGTAPPQPGQPGMAQAPEMPPAGTGGPVKAGSRVWFHYVLKADGKVEADSHTAGAPQTAVMGSGQLMRPIELAIDGMKPGEKKSVTLKPEEAFGPRNEDAMQRIPKANFPNADSLRVGQVLGGRGPGGQQMTAVVKEIGETDIVLDMNHPLAGKQVTFDVEIVSVQ